MRNFLNRISRGGNCVCVSIILGYVCFGSVRSRPKTFPLYRRQLRTKSCGKAFCSAGTLRSSFVNLYSVKKEAVPMIMNFLMESCKPAIGQNKNEKQVYNAGQTADELLGHQFPQE